MAKTFADVLPIKPVTSNQYSVELAEEWCIGTVPNGGYITSALLIGARTHMSTAHPSRAQSDPINLHIQFLRRTQVGPALLTVQEVKLGSRVSNLHIVLSQKLESGKWADEVQGYVTMSNIAKESGLSLDTSYVMHPPKLPADLVALKQNGEDANYCLRKREPFPKFRRAALNLQMYLVKPSRRPADRPKSIGDQWVRFIPGEKPGGRWTNDAMGFLVDIFPQIVEQYINPVAEDAAVTATSTEELRKVIGEIRNEPRAKFWYPTLALNLDIKKWLPEEGVEWLFVRVRAKAIRNGRFDLDVEVWDEQNELVASSMHASLIMDASRNTTRNGNGTGKKQNQSRL